MDGECVEEGVFLCVCPVWVEEGVSGERVSFAVVFAIAGCILLLVAGIRLFDRVVLNPFALQVRSDIYNVLPEVVVVWCIEIVVCNHDSLGFLLFVLVRKQHPPQPGRLFCAPCARAVAFG